MRAQYAASQGGTLDVQGAAARAARGLEPDAVAAVTRRLCRRRACRGSGGITDGSYSTRRMEDAPSLSYPQVSQSNLDGKYPSSILLDLCIEIGSGVRFVSPIVRLGFGLLDYWTLMI